ncbi:MAG: thiamine pyrophosphate-dependent dehydrogenase E1 component subunit alpha [Planctomycetota bacterium]
MASRAELDLYEKMLLVRAFEQRIGELFAKGELFGTTHPCIGQEATAVGVVSALDPDDIVTSTHRGHGHFLAWTDDVNGLMAEIMGKATGVCGGRGGSQHLHAANFYANGITGGMGVVGAGMALAEKRKDSGRIVCSFIGDGALAQGALHEAMNMASLWDAPILYALENNLYAMSTHVRDALAGDLLARGAALGIETAAVDCEDVLDICDAADRAAGFVRENSRPYLLELRTYRFCGHSINDERAYRTCEEEEDWQARDPLARLAARLDEAEREPIEARCRDRIDRAIAAARKAPVQDLGDLGAGLWQS